MVPMVRRTSDSRVPKVAFLFLVRGSSRSTFSGRSSLRATTGATPFTFTPHSSYSGSPPMDSAFSGRYIPSQVTKIQSTRSESGRGGGRARSGSRWTARWRWSPSPTTPASRRSATPVWGRGSASSTSTTCRRSRHRSITCPTPHSTSS